MGLAVVFYPISAYGGNSIHALLLGIRTKLPRHGAPPRQVCARAKDLACRGARDTGIIIHGWKRRFALDALQHVHHLTGPVELGGRGPEGFADVFLHEADDRLVAFVLIHVLFLSLNCCVILSRS